MNQLLILSCIIILIVLFFLYVINIIKKLMIEYFHVNKYKNYIEVQNYFCITAYDIIYKDQILGYVSSGYKISGDDLETSKRNFIKMVVEMLGPQHHNYLIKFYGTEETLYSNLLMWFVSKLDNDELLDFTVKTQSLKEQNQDSVDNIIKSNFGVT